MDELRLTRQSLKVLRAFMSQPLERLSGADISRQSGLKSGTLYPILARFEGAGWLESEWEEADPRMIGRPRRRLYKITSLGQAATLEAFAELGLLLDGRFVWG